MKKISLLLGALMLVGATYACDGNKDKKACCKKGAKKEACAKSDKEACAKSDKKNCCSKGEAKKDDKKKTETKS